MSDFDQAEFMKNQKGNQKTVVENMLTLGASKESAEYEMHIINSQNKKIKRKNPAGYGIQKLTKKIEKSKREIKNLDRLLRKSRFVIITDNKAFLIKKVNEDEIKKVISFSKYEGYEECCSEFIISNNEISYFDQVDWERKYIEILPVEIINE